MLGAVGRFLFGAFVELVQLMLVLVAALFAIEIAIGRGLHDWIATDVPEPPSPAGLFLLLIYALFIWLPARDLVEGWLGMVARRRPDRYEDRSENLGRGVLAVAFSIFWTVLWFVADANANTTQGEAFDRSYALFALAIFGIGGAIPRLWFGVKRSAGEAQSTIPELLAQAGKRGSIFMIAMFIGIALGFFAAYWVQVKRADYVRPALPPTPSLPVEDQASGALCRASTADCPPMRHFTADDVEATSPSAVRLHMFPNLEPPICEISPGWAVDDETNAWFADREPLERERAIATPAGSKIAFDVTLPEGIDHCTYFIDVKPAHPSEEAP